MTTTVTVLDADAALRLDRWFKRHYPALGHGRLEKLPYPQAVRGHKSDVGFSEALTGPVRPDPEVRLSRHAIPDDFPEVHHPGRAERREHGIVEGRASGYVRTLDREVVDNGQVWFLSVNRTG